jgi:CRP/FNR family transcriptional regulator
MGTPRLVAPRPSAGREIPPRALSIDPILVRLAWFQDADEALRAEVRSSVVEMRIQKGEHFYIEGDRCSGFAVLGKGRLRVYKTADIGREITLYGVGEGEACVVSTLSLLLDAPAAASAVAETDVEALLVRSDAFRRWVRERETVRDFVLRALARRMVDVISLVEEVTFRRLDRRVAGHLLARLARDGAGGDGVAVTHQALAGELGATREAVSRILGDLERRGAVTLARGHVAVAAPDLLRLIAEGCECRVSPPLDPPASR